MSTTTGICRGSSEPSPITYCSDSRVPRDKHQSISLQLTSTILVNLVTSDHVNSSSCLFKTEDKIVYACFALYQSSSECSGNTDEIFIYINESFFFLTDLLGYMIIQIIYKQLLLTHILRH